MKRLIPVFICIILCFVLGGCAPGGYLNSTDGEITVSMPEVKDPALPEFTEEQKLILGKWDLVSITVDGTPTTYENSYYHFAETGTCTVLISGTKTDGGFKFLENSLYIDGKKVTYTIENDTLTITDEGGKIHLLTKSAQQ